MICFTGPTNRNLDGFQIIIIFFSVPGHKQKQEDHELEMGRYNQSCFDVVCLKVHAAGTKTKTRGQLQKMNGTAQYGIVDGERGTGREVYLCLVLLCQCHYIMTNIVVYIYTCLSKLNFPSQYKIGPKAIV